MAGSRPLTDEIGAQLAGWGVVAELETRGRRSAEPVTAAVGFVEDDDGSLLVAAGDPGAAWARNLEADPRCRVAIGDRREEMIAEPLAGPEAARAVRALILRYGTPAERLGRGPAFRLRSAGPRASR
ncbi:MAG: nitroreductase family deazaflavin-dependent oxidoreductase [Chloroflexi bacterium]|nr:nitroreductase family deazaflavin-dependent oxidoreductase [Chloroflexota bacterium]